MIKFSLPLIFAIILQALYGAVDLIIVGNFGDAASVSAVATGSHIMQTVTGIITGFTMGITVVIARLIGANEKHRVADVIGNVTVLFGIFAIVITVVMMSMSGLFAEWMQAPPEAFEQCVQYVLICSAGTIFIVAYNVISGIFRGLGNSNLPLIFIAIACIVNIVFDLIFVGAMKLDAIGAALATVLAQAVSVACSLYMIKKKKSLLDLHRYNFRLDKKITKKVLRVGSPIALQDGLTNVSFLIIHAFINTMGVAQSASVGIAEKLFVILSIVPMAFMSTLAAVVAQNEGAGFKKRSNIALLEGIGVSLAFGIATCIFTVLGGDILARIFTSDPAVIQATFDYLKTSGWEYLIIAVLFCILGYFNGKGKTIMVMLQGVLSTFLFRIPLSYYYSNLPNSTMYDMGIPIPISALAALLLCFVYMIILHLKDKKELSVNGDIDLNHISDDGEIVSLITERKTAAFNSEEESDDNKILSENEEF